MVGKQVVEDERAYEAPSQALRRLSKEHVEEAVGKQVVEDLGGSAGARMLLVMETTAAQ